MSSAAEDNYDPQNSAHRLERLRALMKAQQLDAYFVTSQDTGRIRELLALGDLLPRLVTVAECSSWAAVELTPGAICR